ncbi:MAG: hypothetical protein M3083_21080 [Actinomycetota bacterium]|nr:hypothetical protein [Actinomycetota bacterium]
MTVIAALAMLAVVAVATGLAVTVGRTHRKERREVESMFSNDPDERVWWDDRR